MAINIKEVLARTLLDLCRTRPLTSITVKDILAASGVGKQTFYNHFRDKNDLIAYVYDAWLIPEFEDARSAMDFEKALARSFQRMREYDYFLIPACKMEGQNCLKDHIFEHSQDFDLAWHQKLYGSRPMPETLEFATRYHAMASTSMAMAWILSGMKSDPDQLASIITIMRSAGMEEWFQEGGLDNPYRK